MKMQEIPAEDLPFSIKNILKMHRQSRLISVEDLPFSIKNILKTHRQSRLFSVEDLPFSIKNILKIHRQSRSFSVEDLLNKGASSSIIRPIPLYAQPMVNTFQGGSSYISNNSLEIIRPDRNKAKKRTREEVADTTNEVDTTNEADTTNEVDTTNEAKRTKIDLKEEQPQDKCNECGATFSQACSLKRHAEKHDNVIYKCEYCGCIFTRKDSLKRHTKNGPCSGSELRYS